MKFGVNLSCFPKKVFFFEDILKIIAELNYSGIELALSEEDISENIIDFKVKFNNLRRICEDFGLEVPSICGGLFWKYNPLLEENREIALKIFERCSSAAAVVGAKVVLTVPGVAIPDISYEKLFEKTVRWLKEISVIAERNNIIIGVENVWNKYLAGPLEFKMLLDKVDNEYVKAYFDVGNTLPHSLPEHWIKMLNKYIVALHLKDFSIKTFRFGIPLTGSVNWKNIVNVLKEINYNGYGILEIPPYEGHPYKAIQDARTSLDIIFKNFG
ncbi:MAG TPA: sugar phosphate isomerase/epimerase [Thermoprotei archaeon]|nr:sugar phosphate isomerase/epimerase [Thermoprotei archaeon]